MPLPLPWMSGHIRRGTQRLHRFLLRHPLFPSMNPHSDARTMELRLEEEALEEIAAALQCHIRRMKRDLKHREKTADAYEKVGDLRAPIIRDRLPEREERIKKAERIFEKIRKIQNE